MQPLLEFPTESAVCTVSQLTARIRDVLEIGFGPVTVVGEICSLSRPASGHRYFSLRDPNALLRAVVWKSTIPRLRCELMDGMEVVAHGRLNVYAPRGDYQLVIDRITPKGAGRQDLALRQLKEHLHRLGYFAAERKRPLPRFPCRIALVTSPRGAAVRDMLEILGRRWPFAEVVICPVRVQGDEAPPQISAALALLSRVPGIDVVLLGRGGGASDDLSAFNDERVAKAIFQCAIPVVSAVGHEIDVTIADLVADCRALTPSEAAERVAPDCTDVLQKFLGIGRRLSELLLIRLRTSQQRLLELTARPVFRRPLERSRELSRRLDDIEQRLSNAWRCRVERADAALAGRAGRLATLSPLNTLARGYSLTRTLDHRLIRSVTEAHAGDGVEILLADGRLIAEVRAIEPGKPETINL